MPDNRGRKGRQIPLQSILAVSVAGMLAGADSLIAIFRFGRRLRPEALKILGFPPGKAPCHASYFYVFQSIDGDALSRVLGRFALGDASPGHLALDGKTLRGSRRLDDKALHVLSAFATGLSAVVGDLVVEPDQNEITPMVRPFWRAWLVEADHPAKPSQARRPRCDSGICLPCCARSSRDIALLVDDGRT